MKKITFLLVLIGALISCSKHEDNNFESTDLIGQWKLIEQLADPGDGSGTFQHISSQKIIEFHENGVITSINGSLCQPYSEEQVTSGIFSLEEKKITTYCENSNIAFIWFEIKHDKLLLHFISNEGFSQKFKKLNKNI